MVEAVQCVRCNTELDNVLASDDGFQPMGGLAFRTYGHYGSTEFDPMDGSYIEIVLCDICLPTVQKAFGNLSKEGLEVTDILKLREIDAKGKANFFAGKTDKHPQGQSGKRFLLPYENDKRCWDTAPFAHGFSELGSAAKIEAARLDHVNVD